MVSFLRPNKAVSAALLASSLAKTDAYGRLYYRNHRASQAEVIVAAAFPRMHRQSPNALRQLGVVRNQHKSKNLNPSFHLRHLFEPHDRPSNFSVFFASKRLIPHRSPRTSSLYALHRTKHSILSVFWHVRKPFFFLSSRSALLSRVVSAPHRKQVIFLLLF